MTNWEKALLQFILAAAEGAATIFVHSKQGVAVLNATEPLANAVVGAFTTQPPAAGPATGGTQ